MALGAGWVPPGRSGAVAVLDAARCLAAVLVPSGGRSVAEALEGD